MPDAPIKNTFFFKTAGAPVDTGWTETWWSFHASLDLAEVAARQYAGRRSDLLGFGASMLAWRGTLNPAAFGPGAIPKRITKVYFFTGTEGISTTYKAQGSDDFDPAHEDLLLRIQATVALVPQQIVVHRSAFLSGIPDSQTDQLKKQGVNAPYVNDATWKQFVRQLTTIPYYSRIKDVANPGKFLAYAISDVQPIMVRHRNRGRPFFQFRGRRLA